MSGAVFARWSDEAARHARAGDYAWMVERLGAAPRRVLEIGCGGGFSTLALTRAGHSVLVVEPDAACRDAAAVRLQAEGLNPPEMLASAVDALDDAARARLAGFAPEAVVCWMMGVDEATLDRALPAAQAVQQALTGIQRAVVELAAELPSVAVVHLVDRTAFPWKIKDTARETLLMIHNARTCAGLPFAGRRDDALYRKLDPLTWPDGMQRGGSGIVPVLGSLLLRRQSPN